VHLWHFPLISLRQELLQFRASKNSKKRSQILEKILSTMMKKTMKGRQIRLVVLEALHLLIVISTCSPLSPIWMLQAPLNLKHNLKYSSPLPPNNKTNQQE
jgi:hypothetical protein